MNEDAAKQRLSARLAINPETGCHEWMGSRTRGYGYISVEGRMWRAHRLAYTLAKGEIPARLQIDHLCRNPPCCNPDHLEAVSNRENGLRGIGPASRYWSEVCGRGHPKTPENTYTYPNGARRCRICQFNTQKQWARRTSASHALAQHQSPQSSKGAGDE